MTRVSSRKIMIEGPVGPLDTIVWGDQDAPRGLAFVAHPNPTQGGTHDNKVVQTLAKALARLGYVAFCPNLRGVGQSGGEHDEGRGERDDMLAVIDYGRHVYGDLPLVLAGFSFGTYVQAQVAEVEAVERLILVGPAVTRYPVPPVPEHTLVIHGELDEVIPLQAVLDWAREQLLPIVVVPGVGHFFHGRLHQLDELVTRAWPS